MFNKQHYIIFFPQSPEYLDTKKESDAYSKLKYISFLRENEAI